MDSGGDSSRGNSGRSTPAARGGKRKAHSGLGQQNAPSVPAHATLAKARSVDVVGFVEARSFEINALQRSLEAAKTSGNARAFQTLPRHLRRRAASHNVKRIPVRLREKAISEMKKSAQSSKNLKNSDQLTNGKKASRYKRRRTRTVREEYELRQSGKRWLETHVWHAKRMHMKEMWGTMIAETPNERSHRAAYRAAMERTYIQDVSFYATIEITGTETDIFRLLRTMTTPIDPTISKKRYLDGNRVLPLTLYRVGKYPLAALGPAVALWKPMFGTAATGDADGRRMLWLRAHPANAADISAELAAAREQCGFGGLEIGIADITADLVSFELLGNQSTPMLAEVLGHAVDPRSRGSDILHLIRNVPSPACLPESAVIALHVHDPRLRFPYKLNTGNSSLATDEQQRLDKLLIEWPADAAFSDFGDSEGIWNRSRSAESLRNRLSDHELNERRRRQLVPGTKLDPDPAIDVTVPLLLIRSGPEMLLGSQVSNAGSSFVDNLAHGWTLIAPKGWGMPLLLSLVFAGARTQGLQERLHIGFEAGLPSFPAHWPGTCAYDSWQGPIASDDYQRWIHRPPGKRVNYLKFGIKSPFFPSFHGLLGIATVPQIYPAITNNDLECRMSRLQKIHAGRKAARKASSAATNDDGKPTEHECQQATSKAEATNTSTQDIWLACGERLANIVRDLVTSAAGSKVPLESTSFSQWSRPLLDEILRQRGGEMTCQDDEAMANHCLVRVRLLCTGRGTPAKNSPICIGSSNTTIGYVMVGSFSLARGCGMAIGACSLQGLHKLWMSAATNPASARPKALAVLVKSMDGGPDRSAALAILP